MLFDGKFGDPWDDETRQGRFIFIGRCLDKEKLIKDFEACRANLDLRFKVGQDVEIQSDGDFKRAKIVSEWDEGYPYKCKLLDEKEEEDELWAPTDSDHFIRLPANKPKD